MSTGFHLNHTVSGSPIGNMQAFLNQGRVAVDSAQALSAANGLKSVATGLFQRPYPPLKSNLFIVRKYDAGNWATSTGYITVDGAATMRPVGQKAAPINDTEMGIKEHNQPVREFGNAYGYSRKELIYAAKLGIPLDGTKAMLCMQAYETLIDELAANGLKALGLHGLLTHPGISRAFEAVGIDKGSSNQDILHLLFLIANKVVEVTGETEIPDTMVMPLRQFHYIVSTPYNTGSDARPILQVFLQTNPYIKNVVPWDRLKARGKAPKGEKARHIIGAFKAMDETVMRQQIPEAFTTLEPQAQGTNTVVNCVASIGGVEVIKPKAIALFEIPNND